MYGSAKLGRKVGRLPGIPRQTLHPYLREYSIPQPKKRPHLRRVRKLREVAHAPSLILMPGYREASR